MQQGIEPKQKSGLATASLVLGIVGFVFLFIVSGLGLASGIVGLILGIIALAQIKNKGLDGKGQAIAGIILSTLAIVGFVVIIFVLAPMIGDIFESINSDLSGV